MKQDQRPEHQKIAAYYRALIMSGDMKPGDRLPSVSQLIELHSVASHTIQRMIDVLRGEGFVESRQGVGVFVRNRSLILAEAKEYLALPNRLIHVGEIAAPADVAAVFGLESGASVAMRQRVLMRDDEPFELATSHYPLEIARSTDLLSQSKIRGGAVDLLKRLGYETAEFVDKVSTRLPTTQEFELLELPDDIPVHRTFRVLYTASGTPFDVTIMIKGGHLYELLYRQSPR